MSIEKVAWTGTFEEAEERDIEYYAGLSWEESARWVEEMRKKLWWKNYPSAIEKIFRVALLTEDRDDIE